MTDRLDHWIDGVAVPPSTGAYVRGANPAAGTPTLDVAAGGATDVDRAACAAKAAEESWREVPSARRGRILNAIGNGIRDCAAALADMEIQDTGKPRATALIEIENSAAYFEYYAGLVNMPVGDVIDIEPSQHSFTKREPYGVVGVITPWNLPLNQAARAVAPALATANTVVLKPAEVTSQTSVHLARIAAQAGLPPGVLNVVLGSGSEVGEAIVRHETVRKVAFTGSVRTGRLIGQIAANRIIPLTLELGGKSASIVFGDADLDLAAQEAVRAFTTNAGQVCSAATRLLVQQDVHDDLVERVVALAARLQSGREFGPMITRAQLDQVRQYIDLAEAEHAHAALGGRQSADNAFVSPTIYTQVSNDMRIAREEIFGPVLAVIPFEDEIDAIGLANDSEYGLVAGVFTEDIGRALRVADAIEAGQVFINTWSTGAVQTPFGGQKNSGYGREKGIEAMNHYTQVKTIVIRS